MRARYVSLITIVIGLILTLPAITTAQTTWHDNCNTTEGWENSYAWTGYTEWNTVPGLLSTTGDALYTPTGFSEDNGPFWYKDLGDAIGSDWTNKLKSSGSK